MLSANMLGPEPKRSSVIEVMASTPDHCDKSPRSPLDLERVSDHAKGSSNHMPKVPIKKVSFSNYCHESLPSGTQHTETTTEETISTIKEDQDYYYDCDQAVDDNDVDHDDDEDYDDFEGDNDDDEDDQVSTSSSVSAASSTPSLKNLRRRKIRWSGQVRVQEIRHINNMTESEREAVWMSPQDYKMIKNVAKTTVLMMMAGESISDSDPDFCTRGLEFRTRKGNKIRSANKLRARSAVLNEQDLQREEGFHDPEFIAMASLDVSFECREQAQKRGEQDAHSIRSYVMDVPREVQVQLC